MPYAPVVVEMEEGVRILSQVVDCPPDALAIDMLPTHLARKLLQLARDYGSGTGSGTHIALKLSQRELAELVGASRESVNRQLGHWEQAGVLRHERGFITLLDSAVLRLLASLVIY